MALGASAASILRMVLRQATSISGAGLVIGLVLAALATRLMTSLLYGVSPIDPVSFSAGAGLIVTVLVVAALIPAQRATWVDPNTALRSE